MVFSPNRGHSSSTAFFICSQRLALWLIRRINPYLTDRLMYAPSWTSSVKLPLASIVSVLPLGRASAPWRRRIKQRAYGDGGLGLRLTLLMVRMKSLFFWQNSSGFSPGTWRSSSRTRWSLTKKEREVEVASEQKNKAMWIWVSFIAVLKDQIVAK